MSEEIPMAEKLKMLREAMPKGTALGDSGFSGTPAYSDPVVFPSCSVSHDIHEGNRAEPAPFPDDPEVGSSAAAAAEEGAFFSRYANEDGDTFLQGGTVTGGNGGSETVPDYKVSDADTGLVQGLGTILYLEASCEATVADGVMLPGCRLNNASLKTGPSVPSNHTFTTTSKTGKIYREIGRWEAGAFRPAGPPGDFLASGCLGNFNLWRE